LIQLPARLSYVYDVTGNLVEAHMLENFGYLPSLSFTCGIATNNPFSLFTTRMLLTTNTSSIVTHANPTTLLLGSAIGYVRTSSLISFSVLFITGFLLLSKMKKGGGSAIKKMVGSPPHGMLIRNGADAKSRKLA